MNFRVSGALATAATLVLTSAVSAQSTKNFYNEIKSGAQQSAIAPATATTTYQSAPSIPLSSGAAAYAPQGATYLQPGLPTYAPQPQFGANYLPAPTAAPQPATAYTAPTPSYGSPYTPTTQPGYAPAIAPTYVTPTYGTASTTYQPQPLPSYQIPTYQQPGFSVPTGPQPVPVPATAYEPSTPTAPKPSTNSLPDADAWSFNLPRFYPAIQACLRKSSAKNPVIANVQVSDNKTMMLIGEGGSSSYSTCSTGLSGTVVKASSDIRSMPPAFFAPLGSTFTVSPDRPFQPIVDTDQKVIGWLVRTRPTTAIDQFGQAPSFDGQFIRPMMVNTSVGKG